MLGIASSARSSAVSTAPAAGAAGIRMARNPANAKTTVAMSERDAGVEDRDARGGREPADDAGHDR